MEDTTAPDVVASGDEPRTRSVGELLQRLGATTASDVRVQESTPPPGNSTLEVHPDTETLLVWKPVFRAFSADGALTLVLSPEEAMALKAAGASASP